MWHQPVEAETLPAAGTNLAKPLVAHKEIKSDGVYHAVLTEDAVPEWKGCPPYVLRRSLTCCVHVVCALDASLVPQSLVPQSLVPQSLVPQAVVLQSLVPQSLHCMVPQPNWHAALVDHARPP